MLWTGQQRAGQWRLQVRHFSVHGIVRIIRQERGWGPASAGLSDWRKGMGKEEGYLRVCGMSEE